MIWCCPRCHGSLGSTGDALGCLSCGSRYELVDGIPDLRVPGASWIDFDDDLALARDLVARDLPLAELVRAVYAVRPGWDEQRVALRTRQVLQAPARLRSEVTGWLSSAMPLSGRFLDLGCGAGMLLAAAAEQGRTGVGIDVSMTWLVVAKRLITEWGGTPVLAAAMGESLPLAPHAVDSVVSLDVIEHVNDPDRYLREIERVVAAGGRLALSTPNRFSLTAEPHVFVWGVGWLPQRWQRRYVRWRSGKSYDDTRLMGSAGLRRRLRRNTSFDFRLNIPCVSEQELLRFRPAKAMLARLYNRFAASALLRPLFLCVGPFFRIVGRKP